MNRPRKAENRDLPDNLYVDGPGYRYVRPDNGQRIWLGRNRREAIKAAKQANIVLDPAVDLLDKVLGAETTFDAVFKVFLKDVFEQKNLKYMTRRNEMYLHERIIKQFGGRVIASISVKECADYFKTVAVSSRFSANRLRRVLIDVFAVAMAEGVPLDHNPAARTMKLPRGKKQRRRLTKALFDEIHAMANDWLQIAMDLALITLQRRGDVCTMRFDAEKDGTYPIIQQKTGEAIRMSIGPEFRKILARARRTGIPSPYIVHKRYERRRWRQDVDHWTQLGGDYLERKFALLSNEVHPDLSGRQVPSFHEIRALGIKMYRDLGIEPQTLAGHKDKRTTDGYDTGHEIRYNDATTL